MNNPKQQDITTDNKVSFTSHELTKLLGETNPLTFIENIKALIIEKSLDNFQYFSQDDLIGTAQNSKDINILNKLYQIGDDEVLKALLLNPVIFKTHFTNLDKNNLYLIKYYSSKNETIKIIFEYLILLSKILSNCASYPIMNFLLIDKISQIGKNSELNNYDEIELLVHGENQEVLLNTVINCKYNQGLFHIFSKHPDTNIRKAIFLNNDFKTNVEFSNVPFGYWEGLIKSDDEELTKLYFGLKKIKEIERKLILKHIVNKSKQLNR
ncbi:MAG: hypothetical protein V3575_05660 [Candidatus Absconditabacteria bacterium]